MYSPSQQQFNSRVPPTMVGGLGASLITIELYRDGVEAPWGFRLKGGIDVDGGMPLEVTKVRQVSNNF